MALTSAGATWIAQAVKSYFGTGNVGTGAFIGLGSSNTVFGVGQTGEVAALPPRKGMDSGYPSGAGAVLVYQSTFAPAEAVGTVEEWVLANAVSGGTCLGRKAESLGAKLNTQSWTVQITTTFSAS